MKKYLLITLIIISTSVYGDTIYDNQNNCLAKANYNNIKTILIPLNIGCALYDQYHIPINKDNNNIIKISYRFSKTYNDKTIAANLFQYNLLSLQGSEIKENEITPYGLIADYFGASPNCNTSCWLHPTIQNQIITLEYTFEKNNWFFQIDVPFVYGIWEMKTSPTKGFMGDMKLQNASKMELINKENKLFCSVNNAPETNINSIDDWENSYKEGSFSYFVSPEEYSYFFSPWQSSTIKENNTIVQTPTLINTQNDTTTTIEQIEILPAKSMNEAFGNFTFGDLTLKKYNKIPISKNRLTDSSFNTSDIIISIGKDFLFDKTYASLYVKSIIPTGTIIDKDFNSYTFSPVIGNGHHFQLGLGCIFDYTLLHNDTKKYAIHIDAYITHFSPNTQFRTFDLWKNPMSRYIILKKNNVK